MISTLISQLGQVLGPDPFERLLLWRGDAVIPLWRIADRVAGGRVGGSRREIGQLAPRGIVEIGFILDRITLADDRRERDEQLAAGNRALQHGSRRGRAGLNGEHGIAADGAAPEICDLKRVRAGIGRRDIRQRQADIRRGSGAVVRHRGQSLRRDEVRPVLVPEHRRRRAGDRGIEGKICPCGHCAARGLVGDARQIAERPEGIIRLVAHYNR
jgi:hypothetical protein